MQYNTGPNLLDFDDDMFLGPSSTSPASGGTDVAQSGVNNDPLELVDSKGNIFDSLIANNASSTQS